jgi:hypothetical protein
VVLDVENCREVANLTSERTALALRVLTAINDRREPDEREVALLRSLHPEYRDYAADELACIVIQDAMQRKKAQASGLVASADGLG